MQEEDFLFPIRCYTCGNVLGRFQIKYEEMIEKGYSSKYIMDSLGVIRECCRQHMISPIVLSSVSDIIPEGHENFLSPEQINFDYIGESEMYHDEKDFFIIENDSEENKFLPLGEFNQFVRVFREIR